LGFCHGKKVFLHGKKVFLPGQWEKMVKTMVKTGKNWQ